MNLTAPPAPNLDAEALQIDTSEKPFLNGESIEKWTCPPDGYVERIGSGVAVYAAGSGYEKHGEYIGNDVTGQPVFRKIFQNREVYCGEEELEVVKRTKLQDFDFAINIGFTGFTDISDDDWRRHGFDPNKPGVKDLYRRSCVKAGKLLLDTISGVERATGVRIARNIIDGNIDKEVDGAMLDLRREMGDKVGGISVTCPKWLMYDNDDPNGLPVYCAPTQADYSKTFSDLVQLLVVTGGRSIAHKHDVRGTFDSFDTTLVLPLMRMMAKTDPGQAVSVDYASGDELINDAAHAAMENISRPGPRFGRWEKRFGRIARQRKQVIMEKFMEQEVPGQVTRLLRRLMTLSLSNDAYNFDHTVPELVEAIEAEHFAKVFDIMELERDAV